MTGQSRGKGAFGVTLASATRSVTAICLLAILLSACGNGDKPPRLMNIRSTTAGPDEFSILPTKPLEMPEDLATLPEPTPGGANRSDLDPFADIASALGGKKPEAGKGVPGADGALVAHATRKGLGADIREVTAAEDLELRKRNRGRLLERLFRTNSYYRAYRNQELPQNEENDRWRRAGARTPSSPPGKD
jgi:hypothetical protein